MVGMPMDAALFATVFGNINPFDRGRAVAAILGASEQVLQASAFVLLIVGIALAIDARRAAFAHALTGFP